jgi:hypothetical protein
VYVPECGWQARHCPRLDLDQTPAELRLLTHLQLPLPCLSTAGLILDAALLMHSPGFLTSRSAQLFSHTSQLQPHRASAAIGRFDSVAPGLGMESITDRLYCANYELLSS